VPAVYCKKVELLRYGTITKYYNALPCKCNCAYENFSHTIDFLQIFYSFFQIHPATHYHGI